MVLMFGASFRLRYQCASWKKTNLPMLFTYRKFALLLGLPSREVQTQSSLFQESFKFRSVPSVYP
jgi:hypothetical protein